MMETLKKPNNNWLMVLMLMSKIRIIGMRLLCSMRLKKVTRKLLNC